MVVASTPTSLSHARSCCSQSVDFGSDDGLVDRSSLTQTARWKHRAKPPLRIAPVATSHTTETKQPRCKHGPPDSSFCPLLSSLPLNHNLYTTHDPSSLVISCHVSYLPVRRGNWTKQWTNSPSRLIAFLPKGSPAPHRPPLVVCEIVNYPGRYSR